MCVCTHLYICNNIAQARNCMHAHTSVYIMCIGLCLHTNVSLCVLHTADFATYPITGSQDGLQIDQVIQNRWKRGKLVEFQNDHTKLCAGGQLLGKRR